MKEKLFPERSYEAAKIDKFYWVAGGHDYLHLPLIKPFFLYSDSHIIEWSIDLKKNNLKPKYILLDSLKNNYTAIDSFHNINEFNVIDNYIFGLQNEYKINENTVPKLYFIINLNRHIGDVKFYFSQEEFKAELKKLNLPEKFLTPDEVFEQYKNDPVLPWFPEDIKKQLEEVKAKKK